MPTSGATCDWCGQRKTAEEDLRDCIRTIQFLTAYDRKPSDFDDARELLDRLKERYPT